MKYTRISASMGTMVNGLILVGFLMQSLIVTAAELPQVIEWQLFDTRVIDRGIVGSTRYGQTRTGVKIEGMATTATAGAIFTEGTVRIDMTLFSPTEDTGSRKKGLWYLHGNWSITASGADPKALKSRYNPYVVSGVLNATVPFDPMVQIGDMVAEVHLQRAGVKPKSGRSPKNTFSGNSLFTGILTTQFVPAAQTRKEERE